MKDSIKYGIRNTKSSELLGNRLKYSFSIPYFTTFSAIKRAFNKFYLENGRITNFQRKSEAVQSKIRFVDMFVLHLQTGISFGSCTNTSPFGQQNNMIRLILARMIVPDKNLEPRTIVLK